MLKGILFEITKANYDKATFIQKDHRNNVLHTHTHKNLLKMAGIAVSILESLLVF